MENEIIQKYLNGQSITSLSKEYPMSYYSIQKLLTKNQIPIRGGRKRKELTPEQLQNYQQDLQKGMSDVELSKKYNLDKTTLRRIKEENHFERNYNRINKNINNYYFTSIDTAEKAYWLGFLYTDGSVDHYHATGRIRLQLQEQDKEILEKFQQCLRLENQIIYDKRTNSTCCSVEFVSEQIYNDLINFGIVPNKTYKSQHIPFHKIPSQFIPAFLLGLFDGDGSLSCSENYSTDVTLNFTSFYQSVVEDFQLEIDKLINKTTHNKNFFTSAWHTQWRGRQQVLSILNILYTNCPIHLDRKYQLYLRLKDSLK